jgi:hypothetical protein
LAIHELLFVAGTDFASLRRCLLVSNHLKDRNETRPIQQLVPYIARLTGKTHEALGAKRCCPRRVGFRWCSAYLVAARPVLASPGQFLHRFSERQNQLADTEMMALQCARSHKRRGVVKKSLQIEKLAI